MLTAYGVRSGFDTENVGACTNKGAESWDEELWPYLTGFGLCADSDGCVHLFFVIAYMLEDE